MLRYACLDGGTQLVRRAGLGQIAENLPFVDRRHGDVASRIAGQQDARRFRVQVPYVLQKRRAIHARHAHVRHDHRRRAVRLEKLQRAIRAAGRHYVIVASQVQSQAFHDSRLVIHAQDKG